MLFCKVYTLRDGGRGKEHGNKYESEVLQGNCVAGYCLLSKAIGVDRGEPSNFVFAPLLLQASLVKAGVILAWIPVNAQVKIWDDPPHVVFFG